MDPKIALHEWMMRGGLDRYHVINFVLKPECGTEIYGGGWRIQTENLGTKVFSVWFNPKTHSSMSDIPSILFYNEHSETH